MSQKKDGIVNMGIISTGVNMMCFLFGHKWDLAFVWAQYPFVKDQVTWSGLDDAIFIGVRSECSVCGKKGEQYHVEFAKVPTDKSE